MDIHTDELDDPAIAVLPPPEVPTPPRASRRRLLIIISIIALVCVAILIAISLARSVPESSTSTALTSSYPTSSQSPLKKLAAIPVKGRAPKTGYDRTIFGAPWSDDVTVEGGHNGCDTRNDILRRDLTSTRIATDDCIVLSGVLKNPYAGETLFYRQHESESSSPIQIDHVVPLLDAWQKGAQSWDELTRRNFANDPINLQATTAAANQEKSSSDAATWLPSNMSYRCTYATRIVDVKIRYRLWVTEDEREALAGTLGQCGRSVAPPPPLPSVSATTSGRSTMTYQVPPPRPAPAPPSPACYRNINGDCISLPGDFPYPPTGANALCRDGTYSFSDHRRGSCARHGGVYSWLD